MKINWKQKLSSRKFWAMAAAIVVACVCAFGVSESSAETITGVITAVGACVAYMITEAKTDAAHTDSEDTGEEKG